MTRSVSRAIVTWLSAARTRFAVCCPLNNVWLTVAPTERGVLSPLAANDALVVRNGGVGGMTCFMSVYSRPTEAFAETFGR
jgi:hypothetical protein